MIDIVDRLRATADFGIPDYTNSKLLREASDEITRLREENARLREERDKAVEEMWKASDQAQAFRKMAEERKA